MKTEKKHKFKLFKESHIYDQIVATAGVQENGLLSLSDARKLYREASDLIEGSLVVGKSVDIPQIGKLESYPISELETRLPFGMSRNLILMPHSSMLSRLKERLTKGRRIPTNEPVAFVRTFDVQRRNQQRNPTGSVMDPGLVMQKSWLALIQNFRFIRIRQVGSIGWHPASLVRAKWQAAELPYFVDFTPDRKMLFLLLRQGDTTNLMDINGLPVIEPKLNDVEINEWFLGPGYRKGR